MYIFRGLPGSGKSHRASLVACEAQQNGQSVRYCSEEYFFVGVDGKFRFEPSKVEAARDSCVASFQQALVDDVQVICVDTISATHANYVPLLQLASAFKYVARVIDLPCPDVASVQHFFARSRKTTPHEGYSYDFVVSLWSLWEPHLPEQTPPVHYIHDPSMSFDYHSSPSLSIPYEQPPTQQPPQPPQQQQQTRFQYPSHFLPPIIEEESPSAFIPPILARARPHAKKEELLQQLYQLKQQEVVLQQQLKQQKFCDQISSRQRHFPNHRTTVVLTPYNAPKVNHFATTRSTTPLNNNFSFPLLEA